MGVVDGRRRWERIHFKAGAELQLFFTRVLSFKVCQHISDRAVSQG